jgi:hypothetical protein
MRADEHVLSARSFKLSSWYDAMQGLERVDKYLPGRPHPVSFEKEKAVEHARQCEPMQNQTRLKLRTTDSTQIIKIEECLLRVIGSSQKGTGEKKTESRHTFYRYITERLAALVYSY